MPYASHFNFSFISLDASDRIPQISLGKIRDVLAQLQRKTEKADGGEGREAAQFYNWSLEMEFHQACLPELYLFFSPSVGSFFNATCCSLRLRRNVAFKKHLSLTLYNF